MRDDEFSIDNHIPLAAPRGQRRPLKLKHNQNQKKSSYYYDDVEKHSNSEVGKHNNSEEEN